MTGFDFAVLAVVALSALLAFVRGVVRELLAIAAWIVGFVAAFRGAGPAAEFFAGLPMTLVARHVLAFVLILVAVLLVGALAAWMLRSVVHAVGLGFVDRALGGLFGVARGVLLVAVFVLCAGLTSMPRQDWWQNAALGPPLVALAIALRPWLPPEWGRRLDYSPAEKPAALPVADGVGRAPRRT